MAAGRTLTVVLSAALVLCVAAHADPDRDGRRGRPEVKLRHLDRRALQLARRSHVPTSAVPSRQCQNGLHSRGSHSVSPSDERRPQLCVHILFRVSGAVPATGNRGGHAAHRPMLPVPRQCDSCAEQLLTASPAASACLQASTAGIGSGLASTTSWHRSLVSSQQPGDAHCGAIRALCSSSYASQPQKVSCCYPV